jgi:hypothetical protein
MCGLPQIRGVAPEVEISKKQRPDLSVANVAKAEKTHSFIAWSCIKGLSSNAQEDICSTSS